MDPPSTRVEQLRFERLDGAMLRTFSQEVLKTGEIEGGRRVGLDHAVEAL